MLLYKDGVTLEVTNSADIARYVGWGYVKVAVQKAAEPVSEEPEPSLEDEPLEQHTVAELKDIAAGLGLEHSGLRKAELIALIEGEEEVNDVPEIS